MLRTAIAGLVLSGAVAGIAITHNHNVQASATIQQRPGVVKIGSPLGAAMLSRDQVLAAARSSSFGGYFQGDPSVMTFRFGSWKSGLVQQGAPGALVETAARDTWAVTVGGQNFPSHAPIGAQTEMRHFITIYVDDLTGKPVMVQED